MSNGLTLRRRTLGEILTELRVRLGFVYQGSASKGNEQILISFLQEAHDFVYSELSPPEMRKKAVLQIEQDSYLYDWNNDEEDEEIDPGLVVSIWIKRDDSIRERLTQGIQESDRSNSTIRQQPTKYDHLNGQIELYPIPDQGYEMVIEYIAQKPQFSQYADRPGVPDRLLFMYALAQAKAHYRHPDAQSAAKSFEIFLAKEKARQRENKRFFVSTDVENAPQVVRTASGGYTLQA